MSDIADTKKCTNCKLEIPSANFTIHSVHCQRNFYLCSKCEQPVNYSSKIDHDEANHTVVHCMNCRIALEKYLLDDHLENDCPDRDVKCQICDIEVKASDIAEHENYCGSRTEKCAECGEFVMLKYKTLHIDSNHGFIKLTDEPGPSPSWQYGRRTLCNFMPDLSSKPAKPLNKRRSSETFRKSRNSGSSESKEDSDEISKKNFDLPLTKKDNETTSKIGSVFKGKDIKSPKSPKDVDEWPALSSLRSLQISDDKHGKPAESNASNSRQNEVDEDSDLFYAIQVSHEINSDIWRKDKENETLKNSFKPLVENELLDEKFAKKDMFEKGPTKINPEPNNEICREDFNCLYNENDSVKLPCEFCGNLIVSDFLILHQSRCSLYMTDSYTGRSERSRGFQFDDDLEQKIPCTNCNRLFRLSHFENHQLHCQRNSMKSFKNHEKLNYSKNLRAMNMKSEQGLQNGLEPSSPQLTRMGTRSEWLSQLSKSSEGEKSVKNNLSHPDSGVVARGTKVSRKSRRAPSPPRR